MSEHNVTLTVRNPSHKGQMFCYEPAVVTFTGRLLPRPWWVANDSICLSTEDPDFPFRIIKKADIVGTPESMLQPPKSQTFQIKASDGKKYYRVTNEGGIWSCECAGFQFRHTCRHIKEAKERK